LDSIQTGFISWLKVIKGYRPVLDGEKPFVWDEGSLATLHVILSSLKDMTFFQKLTTLWSQESKGGSLDIRIDNTSFIKYLGDFSSFEYFSNIDRLL